MRQKKAVIIGGGLGGLATALRLTARGWAVTVCEQGPRFGGKMNTWCERGYRFDTGPSLITMPWVFEELFKVAGASLEDYLELINVSPISEYVYPDGTRFSYSSSLPDWLAVVRNLDSRDVGGFLKFLKLGAKLYELSSRTFLRRRPADPPDLGLLAALKFMPLRHGWGNYHRTVAAHFNSPHLRQLYDRYPTYVGSSPYSSPATLAVIPYIEYAFGGWYIKGGLYRIVESLAELLKRAGANLITQARVESIDSNAGRVLGVRLGGGTRLAADAVVMNGDASCAPALLGDSGDRGLREGRGLREERELCESERSLSGLVFLFAVARTLPRIAHHSIYFSSDYEREFRELFDERRFPDDPTVYVNAPSRNDRSVVGGEGETLFVMANAPASGRGWDEERVAEARRRIFERLRRGGFPDIERDIVATDVWTPERFARSYSMPGGAIYGAHSHGWKNAFFRPPNKDRRFKGLYYVGGSSHPGGGTPTVLLSARITAELVERFEAG